MEKKVLEHEQTERSLRSLRDQVRKLTNENASLLDRIKKFGALQTESQQLTIRAQRLESQLNRALQEKDELQSLLEFTQAQV